VSRTAFIQPRRLLIRVPTSDHGTGPASVRVWALVPADAAPEVVAQVERVMQIAGDAARAQITASEDRR
jgi:hypothetical protein